MRQELKDLMTYDLSVLTLGEAKYDSPLNLSQHYGDKVVNYVSDEEGVFAINNKYDCDLVMKEGHEIPTFEKAGPRKKLFFEPGESRSAIVTCGGLCPGLNAVIRSIVLMNYYRYKNKVIFGIRNGYQGFIDRYGHEIINMTPAVVENIHKLGGTILGSSRGPQDVSEIVDKLVELKVNVLYTIGGDGTLKGAKEIYNEITKRNLKISVIGVPKTIDNDISFIDRSFGFNTAYSKACESIDAAHVESKGVYDGIGLVKVMGRNSGFIAANTTLASNDVNFTLIPEVPFSLTGKGGFLEVLKDRMLLKHHAVILVAEGAGQELFKKKGKTFDESGNLDLDDIGSFLKTEIEKYFKKEKIDVSVKYIDPSYNIRSTPPTPNDSVFCLQLAQLAVHAGMSGKTNIVIGYHAGQFIHLPIDLAISKRKTIDPESELWLSVLETTGQPISLVGK